MNKELVVTLVFIAMLFVSIGSVILGANKVKDRAAKTECARFSPETGGFEWIDKRGDTK